MKKFGLIGYPIGHSVSPAVFAAGYAGKPYRYDLIEGEDFEESWRRFLEGYDGINVTAPFKELAFAKANIHSPECEEIGATNLLVKTPEGIKAYNSDYYGILFSILIGCGADISGLPATPTGEQCREALRAASKIRKNTQGDTGEGVTTISEDRNWPKSALVVGCGGAGKAAVAAAVNLGLKTTLMNRSIEKAFATAARATVAHSTSTGTTITNDTSTGKTTTNNTVAGKNTDSVGHKGKTVKNYTPEDPVIVRPIEDFCECFHDSDLIIYALPCPIAALEDLAEGAGFPNPLARCTGESTFSLASAPQDHIAAPSGRTTTSQSHSYAQQNNITAPQNHDRAGQDSETASKICTAQKLVIEANYRNPSFTPELIARIQAHYPTAEFMRGNVWHLYQAWSGYILFTGEAPDLAAMAKVDK